MTWRPPSTRWATTRWWPTSSPWTSRPWSPASGRSSRRWRGRAPGRAGELALVIGGPREDALEPALFGLPMMGYLASTGSARYRLGNWFFDRWLRRVSAVAPRAGGPAVITGVNRDLRARAAANTTSRPRTWGRTRPLSRSASTTVAPFSGVSVSLCRLLGPLPGKADARIHAPDGQDHPDGPGGHRQGQAGLTAPPGAAPGAGPVLQRRLRRRKPPSRAAEAGRRTASSSTSSTGAWKYRRNSTATTRSRCSCSAMRRAMGPNSAKSSRGRLWPSAASRVDDPLYLPGLHLGVGGHAQLSHVDVVTLHQPVEVHQVVGRDRG